MNQETNEQKFNLLEMQQALALHVWKNPGLREEIIKNPKATIEKELQVKFDNHIKINIVNHTNPNQVTFVLPYDIQKAAGKELSDSQLEAIAGGAFGFSLVKKYSGKLLEGVGLSEGMGNIADKVGDKLVSWGLPETGWSRKIGKNAGNIIGDILKE